MPKLKGKSVLVTGGAGFIGSHVVDRLVREQPARLTAVDNLFLGKESNLGAARAAFPAFRFYRESVADYDAMRRILVEQKVDVVFDLATIPLPTSLEKPRWTVDENVAMSTVVCELLREGLYQTLVHYSSSEVYGTAQSHVMSEDHPLLPLTPYAASKAAGDHVVLAYAATFGLDVAIIRPFNNFGPRQNRFAYAGIIPIAVQKALKGETITIHGDGEQTRDFIFVEDTADATIRIYEEEATRGQVVNVASGIETSVNDLVQAIIEITGSRSAVAHGPARPGDVRRHCGGIERSRRLIGFEAPTDFRAKLAKTVAWYTAVLAAGEEA